VGVLGICLGSAYLGSFLAQHGRERFVEEMGKFTQAVGEAQALH
jgi:hypothetical protein